MIKQADLRGASAIDLHGLRQDQDSGLYSGEEVRVARSFEWRMIEAALPEAVGALNLVEDFCAPIRVGLCTTV